MQSHAPVKPVTRKIHIQRLKLWIIKGVLKCISIKNKCYRRYLKSKNFTWYKKYYYRDLLNHLKRKNKNDYYASYFEKFQQNYQKLWCGVKDVINAQANNGNEAMILNINGKIISDKKCC